MEIEQKLAFIRKALEMGAKVAVNFYHIVGKEEAEKVAVEFSQMLDAPYEYKGKDDTYWINVKDYSKGVDIAVFYELSEKEKKVALLKQLAELEKEEETTA